MSHFLNSSCGCKQRQTFINEKSKLIGHFEKLRPVDETRGGSLSDWLPCSSWSSTNQCANQSPSSSSRLFIQIYSDVAIIRNGNAALTELNNGATRGLFDCVQYLTLAAMAHALIADCCRYKQRRVTRRNSQLCRSLITNGAKLADSELFDATAAANCTWRDVNKQIFVASTWCLVKMCESGATCKSFHRHLSPRCKFDLICLKALFKVIGSSPWVSTFICMQQTVCTTPKCQVKCCQLADLQNWLNVLELKCKWRPCLHRDIPLVVNDKKIEKGSASVNPKDGHLSANVSSAIFQRWFRPPLQFAIPAAGRRTSRRTGNKL